MHKLPLVQRNSPISIRVQRGVGHLMSSRVVAVYDDSGRKHNIAGSPPQIVDPWHAGQQCERSSSIHKEPQETTFDRFGQLFDFEVYVLWTFATTDVLRRRKFQLMSIRAAHTSYE